MKEISYVLVALILFTQFASADPETERIRKLAEENSAALASGNYSRVVELAYPKVVEMDGNTWAFVDGAGVTNENLRHVLPDFPSQLSLPAREPPAVESK